MDVNYFLKLHMTAGRLQTSLLYQQTFDNNLINTTFLYLNTNNAIRQNKNNIQTIPSQSEVIHRRTMDTYRIILMQKYWTCIFYSVLLLFKANIFLSSTNLYLKKFNECEV